MRLPPAFMPLALALVLLAAGCASPESAPPPLRIGFVPDNPPFAYALPAAPGADPDAPPNGRASSRALRTSLPTASAPRPPSSPFPTPPASYPPSAAATSTS